MGTVSEERGRDRITTGTDSTRVFGLWHVVVGDIRGEQLDNRASLPVVGLAMAARALLTAARGQL
jgi:hypothetical protein